MNASGRQTAPPLFEVVSVTSACPVSLEASASLKDLPLAAVPSSSTSRVRAELSYNLQGYGDFVMGVRVDCRFPLLFDAASGSRNLSAPAVSYA